MRLFNIIAIIGLAIGIISLAISIISWRLSVTDIIINAIDLFDVQRHNQESKIAFLRGKFDIKCMSFSKIFRNRKEIDLINGLIASLNNCKSQNDAGALFASQIENIKSFIQNNW